MHVFGIAPSEVTVLVLVGTDIRFDGGSLNEVPDRPRRDLVFLATREQVLAVLPSVVEVAVHRAPRTECAVDVEFEVMRARPVGAPIGTGLLNVLREIELALVTQVHVDGQLREFFVAEASIREQGDDGLVALAEVLGTSVDRRVTHRVDLVWGEPDVGLFSRLSFRFRFGGHWFIYG